MPLQRLGALAMTDNALEGSPAARCCSPPWGGPAPRLSFPLIRPYGSILPASTLGITTGSLARLLPAPRFP